MQLKDRIAACWPGLLLATAVACVAMGIQTIEVAALGRPWIEGLVAAIVLGTAIRTTFGLHPAFQAGLDVASKLVLEIAIVLLGASINAAMIGNAGALLVGIIASAVLTALTLGYAAGRVLGLPPKLAMLVACGNSICGNSAIMATAPVIGARSDDVTAAVAFTAALGVIIVLLLPLAYAYFGMSERQYGIFVGMTVYAVPQVLAATAPIGVLSMQVGTLVKLVRVLMLGPVVILLRVRGGGEAGVAPAMTRVVPWFILGFLVMMTLRSLRVLPDAASQPMQQVSLYLTVISMAALGLTADLRAVIHAGPRVLAAGVVSFLMLVAISVGLIVALKIG